MRKSKPENKPRSEPNFVIYFDGVCNLCNRFVNLLIRIDHRRCLRYTPLQGETARLRGLHHFAAEDPTSIVVVDGPSEVLTESDAVLQIFSRLGGIWSAFLLPARLIPKSFRDKIYRVIAQNRYGLFGRRDTCRLPTSSERELFLP